MAQNGSLLILRIKTIGPCYFVRCSWNLGSKLRPNIGSHGRSNPRCSDPDSHGRAWEISRWNRYPYWPSRLPFIRRGSRLIISLSERLHAPSWTEPHIVAAPDVLPGAVG